MKFNKIFQSEQNNKKDLRIIYDKTEKIMIRLRNNTIQVNKRSNGFLSIKEYLNYFTIFNVFNILVDMLGVDEIARNIKIIKNRFNVMYNIYSIENKRRKILKIKTTNTNEIYTINNIFNNSIWLEREAWDLYGIFFLNSKDLRRILTDYSFTGYPMRRDYPIVGFFELEYNYELQELIYVPVSLNQENRFFIYNKKW